MFSYTPLFYNLGFIGGGNMSTAILKGVLKSEALPASKIWVSGPHVEHLKEWSDLGATVTSSNFEVYNKCDVIFLGVKPDKLIEAIKGILYDTKYEECKNVNKERQILFVSMLAGISIDDLHKALGALSGVKSVIRIMPNTPMTVGSGACIYTPDKSVSAEQCEILEHLIKGSALCEMVPEKLIDSLGALTGCGPAYMYIVIEALADGAVKQGVPRAMALRFAAQMVVGSGQMVLKSGKHPGLLKDEVCSPGGSTICGVTALERGKIRATLIDAIEASTLRNKELGK